MPFCWFPLNRLGLVEEMNRRAFTKKYSVQFVTSDGRQSQPFYFFEHYDHPSAVTWQIERSEFDQLLLNNARRKGAEILELTPVKKVIKDAAGRVTGVEAMNADGQIFQASATFTIDCSGREQVATARDGWRLKDPQLNKLAIWTYYRGAKRDEGIDEGNTTVAYVDANVRWPAISQIAVGTRPNDDESMFATRWLRGQLALLTPPRAGDAGAGLPQLARVIQHSIELFSHVVVDLTGFKKLGEHLAAIEMMDGVIVVARAGRTTENELLRLNHEMPKHLNLGVLLVNA